ncbi:MAG: hypothetical protein CVU05_01870 [Bacteroidetes bacterium HGW-Bacteroidetes-21]|jgi:glycosyltransferase involved in cell wall biosynthesis|nr:MAG: hypothetical protein CVU05_01870 [Bacteroidetes bacterium HGW-Bacteroidetes-21]
MSNKPHILYITYDGLSDPLGKSQILPYIKALSKAGYRFTILSFEKKQRIELEKTRIEKELQEYDINWHYALFTSFPPFFSKIKDIISLYKISRRIAEKDKIDAVHCRSYVASLAGLNLKKKKGIPFIFDMRGFWADERIEGNIWNGKNPLFRRAYHYFLKKEKLFFEISDAVVSLTYKGIEVAEKRYNRSFSDKAFVVRTCTDTTIFNVKNCTVESRAKFRSQITKNNDAFVLVYAGSTGTWYMMEDMFRFFEKFLQHKPGAIFLILTQTPEAEVRVFSSKIPAENVVVKSVEYGEMPQWLHACDAGIYFIRPLLSKQASTAVKTGEMAACGLPAVVNAIGDMEMLFKNYQMGIMVGDLSDASLEEAARKLSLENIPRAEFPPEFSLDAGVEKYKEVYSFVSKTGSSGDEPDNQKD